MIDESSYLKQHLKENIHPMVLVEAVKDNNLMVVNYLIECGININYIHNNMFVFKLACLMNYYEIAELLLKNNCNIVNNERYLDKTPLRLAIEEGNIEIVKLFIKYKLDLRIKEACDKLTPFKASLKYNRKEITKLIIFI